MNLAILHYHLNRGGVTRVIENHLAALDTALGAAHDAMHDTTLDADRPWRVALLFGGRCEGFPEDLTRRLASLRVSLYPIEALDYDGMEADGSRSQRDDVASESLYRQLNDTLGPLGFQPGNTVLHVHNHALGKNRSLLPVLARLAEAGYAMVLQIHDFVEDFRPANYRHIGPAAAVGLYPQAPAIHYCVLNGRDHGILREAGVSAERLHLLPNPVSDVPGTADVPSKADARAKLCERFGVGRDDRLLLYPVRGIRRKNLGEALFYSALAPRGQLVGVTLPPLNPAELPVYEGWKRLAAELHLPCRFELGASGGLGLAENMAAADAILTTSLAEGFGMVFLETWLAGLPLVGRDLPDITSDFLAAGVRLDGLQPQLRVPLDWIGAERFCRALRTAYLATLAAYGCPTPPGLDSDLQAKIAAGWVDFGDLDEPMQAAVIRSVCRSESHRRRMWDENPWLADVFTVNAQSTEDVIEQNKAAIRQHFSLAVSGRRLLDLYAQAAGAGGSRQLEPLPHGEKIMARFLEFNRFRLIRT